MNNLCFLARDLSRGIVMGILGSRVEIKTDLLDLPMFLHQVFERTVQLFPDKVAVEDPVLKMKLCYRELNQRANLLAFLLQEKKIKVDQLVGIYLPRGVEQYISMLGILKSGAAYLPIDKSFPEDRVRFTLEDAKARFVLTTRELWKESLKSSAHPIFMDEILWGEAKNDGAFSTPKKLAGESFCYVIYTSGTTGKPKGVGLSHLNVLTYIRAMKIDYKVLGNDRILQGFSTSFDASVEEIWMAFHSGATLVVADEETMRSIDELPQKLRDWHISVFSTVPTVLDVMDATDLPELRYLLFGGEAARRDLIDKWDAPNRHLFNGYGPTECTVVSTYSYCKAGEVVTIGKPLLGYHALILDPELKASAKGEEGELCIGGDGVSSRGYLGRPELNESKFFERDGVRFYRTGDLVKLDQKGDLLFCGRIDTQVKIRGYRVELGEIEVQICECCGCESSIVTVEKDEQGTPLLIAYLIQSDFKEQSLRSLRSSLAKNLPSYMIPQQFVSLEPSSIPRMNSGKIDRRSLPSWRDCRAVVSVGDSEFAEPEQDLPVGVFESKLLRIWRQILQQSIGLEHSFFDFGGNSVMAAQVITQCRQEPELLSMGIRDLYRYPTIRELSRVLEGRYLKIRDERSKQKEGNSTGGSATFLKRKEEVKQNRVSSFQYGLCIFLQGFVLLFLMSTGGYSLFAIVYAIYYLVTVYLYQLPLIFFVILPILSFLVPVLFLSFALGFGLLTKKLLIGRYEEGDYPIWGGYYFRWWLARLLMAPIRGIAGFFLGSTFVPYLYRLLGANIGKDVYLGSAFSDEDLVTIEDGASIAQTSILRTHSLEDGLLRLRKIQIGKNAFVGSQSIVCGDTIMAEGTKLHHLSCLSEGSDTEVDSEWFGSPAVPIQAGTTNLSRLLQKHEAFEEAGWGGRFDSLKIIILQLGCLSLLSFLLLFPISLQLFLLLFLQLLTGAVFSLNLWILCSAAFVFSSIRFAGLLLALLLGKWGVTGKAEAGTIRLDSFEYVRRWFCRLLMEILVDPRGARPITETLFMPSLCRLLGMQVGSQTEVSDVTGFQPDLVKIGDGAMLADRCIVGAPIVHRGRMTLGEISIGDRSFVANVAHVPITTPKIGDNSLIGVLSTPPDQLENGSDWLGSPPMKLHKRTKISAPSERTYDPPRHLVWARAFFNVWKIILPGALVEIAFWISLKVHIMAFIAYETWVYLLLLPFIVLAYNLGLILFPVLFKWLMIWRYRSGEKLLYCFWMWRIEIVYEVELLLMSVYQTMLDGTPFLCLWYRLMGAKIGRRVCILGGSLMEPDLIEIEDHVSLEGFLQTHLFEDRVMKLGSVLLQEGCSVRSEGCVLYHAKLEPYATLKDLSLIMKHETFLAGRKYQGLPAEEVSKR